MIGFYHYSQKPIVELYQAELVFGDTYCEKRIPFKNYLRPYMKPDGLWISVEDDFLDDCYSWQDYCRQIDSMSELLIYKYHIQFVNNPKLLVLDTVASMYQFLKKYEYTGEGDIYRKLAISWQDVAKDYPGIIIAPYHYSLRLHPDFHWYYPWDCASGCVWDISVIQSITLLQGG